MWFIIRCPWILQAVPTVYYFYPHYDTNECSLGLYSHTLSSRIASASFEQMPWFKVHWNQKMSLLFSAVSISLIISFSRFIFWDNENKRWCVLSSREWVWKSWQLVFYFSKYGFRCFSKTSWNVKIIVACEVFAVLKKRLVVFFSIFFFIFFFCSIYHSELSEEQCISQQCFFFFPRWRMEFGWDTQCWENCY